MRPSSGPAPAREPLGRSGDEMAMGHEGASAQRPVHAGGRTVWLMLGIACLAGLIWIHAYLVPMHLEEQPYIGWLFVVASVILTLVTLGLLWPMSRWWSWWVGAAICLGMAVAYVASRTVGLPRGYHESWRDGWGTVCLVLEACYVVAMVVWFAFSREE